MHVHYIFSCFPQDHQPLLKVCVEYNICDYLLISLCLTAPTATLQFNSSTPTSPMEVQFGTPFTLNCSFTQANMNSRIEWLINGVVTTEGVSTTNDGQGSALQVSAFEMIGIYQCRITNADASAVASVNLCASLVGEYHYCLLYVLVSLITRT